MNNEQHDPYTLPFNYHLTEYFICFQWNVFLRVSQHFLFDIKSSSPGLLGKPYVTFFEKLNSSFWSFTLSAVGPCPRPHINFNIVLPVTVSEKKDISRDFWSQCEWLRLAHSSPTASSPVAPARRYGSHTKNRVSADYSKKESCAIIWPPLTYDRSGKMASWDRSK